MKVMIGRTLSSASIIAIAAFGFSTQAVAQQAGVSARAASESNEVEAIEQETIIVTATRRDTNLQKTPLAITALTAGVLAQNAAPNLLAIGSLVPNFSISNIAGNYGASLSLRGRALSQNSPYQEAPVAVLVDDFVTPHVQSQVLDTFDIESIEVLRGPQGTLYGKNSTAGAVLVRTKRPSLTEVSAQAQFEYGSWNSKEVKIGVNVPLIDGKLGLRLVGNYHKDDGYYHNGGSYGPIRAPLPTATTQYNGLSGVGDGKRMGGRDVFNGRIKLLAAPSDDLQVLLQYERLHDRSDANPVINVAFPGQSFPSLGFPAQNTSGDPLDHAADVTRAGFLANQEQSIRLDIKGYYANIDWDTPLGKLSSVTGYNTEVLSVPNSYTGVAPELLTVNVNQSYDDRKYFTQELRFAGEIGNDINYVVGGFYQKYNARFCQATLAGLNDLLTPIGTVPYAGGYNNNPRINCNQERGNGLAGFVDLTWKATDRLTITGGFRYTHEKKKFTARNETYIQELKAVVDPNFTWDKLGNVVNALDFDKYPGATGIGRVDRSSKTWNNPTYRVNVAYQATDTLYGYFAYAHGFKSGGYNAQVGRSGRFIAAGELAPYNEENVDSFELGLKSDLFDRRLRLNITGFYGKYDDLQVFTIRSIVLPSGATGTSNVLTNASSAKIKGIELEANAILTSRLRFNLVGGYLNTKYGTFIKNPAINLTGEPLERAPEWQGSANLNYTLPLNGNGTVAINAAVTYEDRSTFSYSDVNRNYDILTPQRTLVNGSVTYTTENEKYYVRALVRNLFDKRYVKSGASIGAVWAYASYGDPRYVAVQLGAKF